MVVVVITANSPPSPTRPMASQWSDWTIFSFFFFFFLAKSVIEHYSVSKEPQAQLVNHHHCCFSFVFGTLSAVFEQILLLCFSLSRCTSSFLSAGITSPQLVQNCWSLVLSGTRQVSGCVLVSSFFLLLPLFVCPVNLACCTLSLSPLFSPLSLLLFSA